MTINEPVEILKQTARQRGYSDEEAKHFFLLLSAVEQVDTVDGKSECFRLGWLAREQSGVCGDLPQKTSNETTIYDDIPNHVVTRLSEDTLAESHFTLTARKAAEVNEGGLVDPKVP